MIIQVDHGVGPSGVTPPFFWGLEIEAKMSNCGTSFGVRNGRHVILL
jgi:hypothetical protein